MLRKPPFHSLFTPILRLVRISKSFKVSLEKPIFFLQKPNFEYFENFYHISRTPRRLCYLWERLTKFKVFFTKPFSSFFEKKNPIFERFDKSNYSRHLLKHICYLWDVLKFSRFFSANPIIIPIKKPNF